MTHYHGPFMDCCQTEELWQTVSSFSMTHPSIYWFKAQTYNFTFFQQFHALTNNNAGLSFYFLEAKRKISLMFYLKISWKLKFNLRLFGVKLEISVKINFRSL